MWKGTRRRGVKCSSVINHLTFWSVICILVAGLESLLWIALASKPSGGNSLDRAGYGLVPAQAPLELIRPGDQTFSTAGVRSMWSRSSPPLLHDHQARVTHVPGTTCLCPPQPVIALCLLLFPDTSHHITWCSQKNTLTNVPTTFTQL